MGSHDVAFNGWELLMGSHDVAFNGWGASNGFS